MVDARVWKQVKDEARQSLVRVLEYPSIRIATEGGRIDSRRSERVSEVRSPSILKLVRRLVSPLHILSATTMSSWTVVRADILQELLLVTHCVTLGRR